MPECPRLTSPVLSFARKKAQMSFPARFYANPLIAFMTKGKSALISIISIISIITHFRTPTGKMEKRYNLLLLHIPPTRTPFSSFAFGPKENRLMSARMSLFRLGIIATRPNSHPILYSCPPFAR